MFHSADKARVIYYRENENKFHEVLLERTPESLNTDYSELFESDTCVLKFAYQSPSYNILTQDDVNDYQRKYCDDINPKQEIPPQWIVHEAQIFDFHALHCRNIKPSL